MSPRSNGSIFMNSFFAVTLQNITTTNNMNQLYFPFQKVISCSHYSILSLLRWWRLELFTNDWLPPLPGGGSGDWGGLYFLTPMQIRHGHVTHINKWNVHRSYMHHIQIKVFHSTGWSQCSAPTFLFSADIGNTHQYRVSITWVSAYPYQRCNVSEK